MDLNQAESFLISQTKKANSRFTDSQAKVFLKFWKLNKGKVHESIISKCKWDNQLKAMSWRIDIQSRAKNKEDVNATTAIIEMELQNQDSQVHV